MSKFMQGFLFVRCRPLLFSLPAFVFSFRLFCFPQLLLFSIVFPSAAAAVIASAGSAATAAIASAAAAAAAAIASAGSAAAAATAATAAVVATAASAFFLSPLPA